VRSNEPDSAASCLATPVWLIRRRKNGFLREWELTVADKRIHGTTRRQVGKHFADAERQALLPLPLEPFPSFHEERRMVHRDGHVEVKRAYYAVPPEYLAREVWVRWDARLVRIFNDRMQQIAAHVRKEPGCFSTPPEYIAAEKVSGLEHGAASLLVRVAIRLGPKSAAWGEAMVQARGIEGTRLLLGLFSLSSRHSTWAVEQACAIALTYAAFHLRAIRALVKRQGPGVEKGSGVPVLPRLRDEVETPDRFPQISDAHGPSVPRRSVMLDLGDVVACRLHLDQAFHPHNLVDYLGSTTAQPRLH
jgi:hypothetical protein